MQKLRSGLVIAVAICLLQVMAASVSADELVFRPTDDGSEGLPSLDHHYLYTWSIDPALDSDMTVTGAHLTFTNFYNWLDEDPYNVLWLHLIHHVSTEPGVDAFRDDASDGYVTDQTDDFIDTRWHADPGWLVPTNPDWTDQEDTLLTGLGPFAGPGSDPVTWTYDFTEDQWMLLNAYIHDPDGQLFALGFDPQCHFFYDDMYLTLDVDQTPVPEPTTLVLVGGGVLGLLRRRRIS